MNKLFSHRIRDLSSVVLDGPAALSGRAHALLTAAVTALGATLLGVGLLLPESPPPEESPPPRIIVADARADAAKKQAQETAWEKELKWRQEANEAARRNKKRDDAETERLRKK